MTGDWTGRWRLKELFVGVAQTPPHRAYNARHHARSSATMPDHSLPPIVYLPSSGGYTSSRIVPEVRRFSPPFTGSLTF